MAGRDRMAIAEVVRQVLREEHADVIRESVRVVAREIMDQAKAAVSEDRWTRARTEVRISLPPPSGGGRAATMAVGPYR